MLEKFIASCKHAPHELVLDFDGTDDPSHGRQEGPLFHGYYDSYRFLPLYVLENIHRETPLLMLCGARVLRLRHKRELCAQHVPGKSDAG